MDDYYPAPNTGFVVCDREGRIIASGRGVFELTGYREQELLGGNVVDRLRMSGFENGTPPRSRSSGASAGSGRSSTSARVQARRSRSLPTSSRPTTTTAGCWSR